ncbi:hypothetical protein, partial [Duganella callida]|uniref:hypothetical protein n=1 Tax=Duganella callida TaxID=2561932 RepID=UPI0014300143
WLLPSFFMGFCLILLACLLAYMSADGAPLLHAGVDPGFTLVLHLVALPLAAIVLLTMWPRLARLRSA